MIKTFVNRLTHDLFADLHSKETRAWSSGLREPARRKLSILHEAGNLTDLRVPPANRLEQLKGDWKGRYSIRINRQWRIVFLWEGDDAYEGQIIDYH